jgi:hypothetical protein
MLKISDAVTKGLIGLYAGVSVQLCYYRRGIEAAVRWVGSSYCTCMLAALRDRLAMLQEATVIMKYSLIFKLYLRVVMVQVFTFKVPRPYIGVRYSEWVFWKCF